MVESLNVEMSVTASDFSSIVTSINAVTAVMSSPQRTRNALKRVDSA